MTYEKIDERDENKFREQSPYHDWVIVILGGTNLIGRPDGSNLHPVYQLVCSLTSEEGDVRVHYRANPVLMLPSVRTLACPMGFPKIALASLPITERQPIETAIANCEEIFAAPERRPTCPRIEVAGAADLQETIRKMNRH